MIGLPTVTFPTRPKQLADLALILAVPILLIGVLLWPDMPSANATAVGSSNTIIIVKRTIPEDHPQSFEFTGDLGTFSLTDDIGSTFNDLSPAIYVINETVPAGWDPTPDISCFDAGAGVGDFDWEVSGPELTVDTTNIVNATFFCEYTNTLEQPGNITIFKETDPDNSTQLFNFTGSLGSFTLGDGQNMTFTVPSGDYSVNEIVPAGWTIFNRTCNFPNADGSSASFPGLNSMIISLVPNGVVECTFNNEDIRGNITIAKETIPDGSTQLFNFTGDLGNFTLGDGQNMTFTIPSGVYNVGEIIPSGWSTSQLIQCSVSPGSTAFGFTIFLAPSGTVTCTWFNEQILSNITIIKQTDPDGSTQLFNFTGDLGNFTLGDGQNVTFTGLEFRSYNVTEIVPPGWNFDIQCFLTKGSLLLVGFDNGVSITPGITGSSSNLICTVTNEADRGTIIVEKQTIPDGAAGSFTFTGNAAGTIGDNGTIVVPNLLPGNYSTTEVDPAPFILTNIACNDTNSFWNVTSRTATFVLEPGEVVKCTFTNTNVLVVEIDIKPGSDPNAINLKKDRIITVAILGNATFDVHDIDVSSLSDAPKFGGSTPKAPIRVSYKDVNNDGFTDLVLQYRLAQLGFTSASTEGCISGKLTDGTMIEGCDSVKIVPK